METSYRPLRDYGTIAAVDVPLFAHKFAAIDGSTQKLANRFVKLAESLILVEGLEKVFWVLDGSKNVLKAEEHAQRAVKKKKFEEKKREKQETMFQVVLEEQSSLKLWPTSEDYELIEQAVIQRFGSTSMIFLKATFEAEAKCAALCRRGEAHMVLTEDTDAIAMLAKKTILKYNPGISHVCVNLDDILISLEMTPRQFQAFCCLCGNDFVPRLPGLGPNTLLKLKSYWSGFTIEPLYEKLDSSKSSEIEVHKSKWPASWTFFETCGSELV